MLGKKFHIFLICILSIAIFGLNSAFANSVADSPWTSTVKNYAKITVVADCNAPGNGGDSDNDGICDNWESTTNPGLHINFTDTSTNPSTTYVYNLRCVPGNTIVQDPNGTTVCPSPNKKDIFLELDWMTGHAPSKTALADVVKAFDKINIALHIIGGENNVTNSGNMGLHYCYLHPAKASNTGSPITNAQCSFTGSTPPSQSLALIKRNFFGTTTERAGDLTSCPSSQLPPDAGTGVQNANSYNCLTAKRQVFHYMVLANNLAVSSTGSGTFTSQSGWAEVPGNDAVSSLGSFTNGHGNIEEQEGTMLHELGHNLGLHHGGDTNPTGTTEDDNNCKPNYLSVMSYTYEFRKTGDLCRPLLFSNSTLSTLSESTLTDSNIDPNGVATYPSDNPNPPDRPNMSPACPTSGERKIVWASPSGVQNHTAGAVIDWNMNGTDTHQYQQNLNKLGIVGCNTTVNSTLTGFNDTNYIYNGGNSATLPLVFRTSALQNFAGSTVAGGEDADIGQGEVTISESGEPLSLPPSPPTGLVATASSSGVALSWSAASGNGLPIIGYEVERTSGGSFDVIQANTGSSDTTFTDPSTSPSTTYTYQVSGINSFATSDPSNQAQATTPPPGNFSTLVATFSLGALMGAVVVHFYHRSRGKGRR